MLASDLEYVCTRTVVLDLKILARMLKQILSPNASSEIGHCRVHSGRG